MKKIFSYGRRMLAYLGYIADAPLAELSLSEIFTAALWFSIMLDGNLWRCFLLICFAAVGAKYKESEAVSDGFEGDESNGLN